MLYLVPRGGSAHLCGALMEPVSLTRSDAMPRSRTKRGSAIDARLHTAVSSGLVYSRISVHRLLHLIVPCRGKASH